MKKLLFLLIAAFFVVSCTDESRLVNGPNNPNNNPNINPQQNIEQSIYTEFNLSSNLSYFPWVHHWSTPVLVRKTIVNNQVFLLYKLNLNACTSNPSFTVIGDYKIPHVGPGGIVIYENVANDATYTILGFGGGHIYILILSETGHELKWNISLIVNGLPGLWFLVIPVDDGTNNINTILTQNLILEKIKKQFGNYQPYQLAA